MEDKKNIFIFFAAFFLLSGLLCAQEFLPESQPGYYIDKNEGEPVFKQRLVWDKDEYASRYEVEIQMFSTQYNDYYTKTTNSAFIEISLHPGKYRYCVTPYDLLGNRCESSDWEEFTVDQAYQPEIINVVPEFFYMDQTKDRVLLISGNNIFDDSDIYLRNGETILFPIKRIITDNSSVKLTFNDDALIPGTYEIYIKNPGGLDVIRGGFIIGYAKRYETFIKLGYNPVIPVKGYYYNVFGNDIYQGVTLRLESLTSKRASFKAGIELAASLYYLVNNREYTEDVNIIYNNNEVTLFDLSVNVSLQSRYNHLKNAVTLSAGFGITNSNSIINYDNGYSYDSNEINVQANLNLSGLFLLYKDFYIETGVEFAYYFSDDSFLIKPKISLVYRF